MCSAVVVWDVLQRIWEPWRWVKWPAVGSWQWSAESSIKLIFLRLHKQLLKNPTSTILWSFSIWSKLEKWKSLIRGCLISWLKSRKLCFDVLSSLILCNNSDHFSIGLWHAVKSGLYMTTSNDQVSGWTDKKLQTASHSQT